MLKVDDFALEAVQQDGHIPEGRVPKAVLFLGSGMTGLTDEIKRFATFTFKQLWPWAKTSQTEGHKNELILGKLNGVDVICFSGRFHLYEGYTPAQVVQPILLAQALGVTDVLMTNAAGGISVPLKPGDLMLVKDHIGTFMPKALTGDNNDSLGPRFPDMSDLYSKDLQGDLRLAAASAKLDLREGVLSALPGPAYETAAEIQMLQNLNIDAVGMSIIMEAIVAHWCGMRVACITLISNMGTGLTKAQLEHPEVVAVAKEATPRLIKLITSFLDKYVETAE